MNAKCDCINYVSDCEMVALVCVKRQLKVLAGIEPLRISPIWNLFEIQN